MAKTIEILEIEKARASTGDVSTIHLFPEGTFYRAYEWSAWLCCRYINEFKPTKRELSHWSIFNTRQSMFLHRHNFTRYGMFNYSLTRFYD